MNSKGHLATAQRSETGRLEWAAEHADDLQGTGLAVAESFGGGDETVAFSALPSQRMHSNGRQGNQTRSLPVSR